MKEINLLVFKNNLKEILKNLGFDIYDNRIFKNGKQVVCETCGKKLTIDNVGFINNKGIFCDNVACLSLFIARMI